MIQLQVEPYCHQCPDFCSEVMKTDPVYLGDTKLTLSDTIVKCAYRKRCAGIYRYLNNRFNNVEDKASGE